ncbi:release factor glutamine methyltransferase [Ekhidna lutea]|uniref:Release factor glutamine methyltransferase n=1 Tax=Ekhidna lutea TaxID=447679 RepID=A0A239FIK4_EKHLU|nr:peptide chain release factor N(5)-glutamine methyltransferase [Ekhidna lutea]SNS56820.1 release factor glutamine methyltransferase [Ekhidna lutea]
MKNVKQIWQETAKQLEKVYDRREAENISHLLLEDLFGVSRAAIISDELLDLNDAKLKQSIGRLLKHEPIQYITGVADFYGRKFHIAPGALIPRPETEELVDLIIQENKIRNPRILDVGVGSGCIAVSLAIKLGGNVFGTDLSKEALEIAAKNAQELGAKINFTQHDILSSPLPEGELDILVSNPPYIPLRDQKEMRVNVLKYEPELALFVPDDDPLIFYKRIAVEGLKSLKKGGKLYFEIHENFGIEVKAHLQAVGYSEVNIHKDMQGKHRIVSGIKA